VLVIGIGTGQTASRFLLHGVRQLDAVDIEPAIFPFVAAHFDAAWMRDPRTRLIPDDGRTYVAHAAARYDVISVEVGQVFRPGVEAFYTREFYRLAEARLNPGGLLAQFVPIGFLGADDLRRVVATFRERFPECVLWHNAGELLLIGRRDAPLRLAGERLAVLTRDGAVRSDLQWAHWGGESNWQNRPATFLAGFLSGPRGLAALAAGAPAYRDDRPVLAYATSRARPAQRHETANVDLLRRHLQPVTAVLAEASAAAAGTTGEAAEAAEIPDIGALLPEVERRREQNLRDIVAISWLGYVGELKNRLGPAAIEQALGEALRLSPENADANRMRGDALLMSGRAAEAERFYAAAVRLDPEDPLARRGLALVYLDTGRPAQAVPLLLGVLAQDPADAPAENYLGAALAQQGRLSEAIARFEAALRLQPGYREAQLNLARARAELQARPR
jgi:spermidine synthase